MKKILKYWLVGDENPKKYVFEIFLALTILLSVILLFFQNENGTLPDTLVFLDIGIAILFIIEYLARFYISSDFRKDVKHKNIFYAVHNKLKWMIKPSSLLDFLSIIPYLTFFRIFRVFRFIRLLRLFKLVRAFKIFRDFDKLHIILQGMREQNRVFYIFFMVTFILIICMSFIFYSVENTTTETEFSSFKDALWYTLKTINFVDDTPKTVIGKIFSSLLLLFNMAIFGFFISIILNKINQLMNAITTGKISNLKIKNHIVICGYTKSSQNVIEDLLRDKKNYNKIVLVSTKSIQDTSGLIYVNADFTEYNTMSLVNIKDAKFAIVFAESKEHDTIRDVDLRTVMTIFNIEKEAPKVHTIAEINDHMNAEIIKDKIEGDEILYKELIDSRIITTCIDNPHISNLFYELFGNKKERIKSTNIIDLHLENLISVKKLKLFFLERNQTFLGVIDPQNCSILSPDNDMEIDNSFRLIYLT